MEALPRGKVVETEFGNEIAAFLHFGVNTAKGLPVNGVKGPGIRPMELVLVVGNESWESSCSADCCFETSGEGNSIDREHDLTVRVKGYMVVGGRELFEFQGGKSVGFSIHFGIKGKILVANFKILGAINVFENGEQRV